MKIRIPTPFIALFALLLAGGNVSAAPFTSLYAFGDSLSDVGSSPSAEMSLYKILVNNCDPSHPCGPYAEGRISNGPVATEYLAGLLFPQGISFQSYAVAGATTGIGNMGDGGSATREGDLLPIPVPGAFPLPGMKGELEQYMEDANGQADPNALYFVWGGANDFGTNDSPTMAAQNISGYVGQLAAAGAEHILVPNLGDLSLLPEVRAGGADVQTQAYAFSLSFNGALAAGLGDVSSQFPAAQIYQFDTYSFLNDFVANPPGNFTDVQNACLTGDDTVCANPAGHLWWDGLHPTTSAHSVIASGFASAVPEPETYAMFVIGLFVLGIVGNRRRNLATSRVA